MGVVHDSAHTNKQKTQSGDINSTKNRGKLNYLQ